MRELGTATKSFAFIFPPQRTHWKFECSEKSEDFKHRPHATGGVIGGKRYGNEECHKTGRRTSANPAENDCTRGQSWFASEYLNIILHIDSFSIWIDDFHNAFDLKRINRLSGCNVDWRIPKKFYRVPCSKHGKSCLALRRPVNVRLLPKNSSNTHIGRFIDSLLLLRRFT